MDATQMVTAEAVATEAKANAQDIATVAAKHPAWFQTINGRMYVTQESVNYAFGALWAAIENRKDARIAKADAALTAAYDALRAHPRMPRTTSTQAKWQSTALRLFADVATALTELVDAKVDADSMSPARAERIRSEALAIQRTAETSAQQAMRKALRLSA